MCGDEKNSVPRDAVSSHRYSPRLGLFGASPDLAMRFLGCKFCELCKREVLTSLS